MARLYIFHFLPALNQKDGIAANIARGGIVIAVSQKCYWINMKNN